MKRSYNNFIQRTEKLRFPAADADVRSINMKIITITLISILLFTSFGFCQNVNNDLKDIIQIINDENIPLSSIHLEKCPFNHHDIKRVPIISGYRFISPEQQKKIDNLELYYAGCIVGDEKYQIICSKCRYLYNPYGGGYWYKEIINSRNFLIEFDHFVNDFKEIFIDDYQIDSFFYMQEIFDDTKYSDQLTFFIKEKMQPIKKILDSYFIESLIKTSNDNFHDNSAIFYNFSIGNILYKVSLYQSVKKYSRIEIEAIKHLTRQSSGLFPPQNSVGKSR